MRRCITVLAATVVSALVGASATADEGDGSSAVAHLVISELVTGGTAASDEFIELYNPSAETLSLGGLEVVYVTASGASVSRRASWEHGSLSPRGHLLLANEDGIFAPIADVLYSGGLSASGGTIVLRRTADEAPTDAVGWGSASSGWVEGDPAPAPPARSGLERLPGGDAGSGSDTDDNAADFVVRPAPQPQNQASPTVPGAPGTPLPSPSAPVATPSTGTSEPTASGSASASPTPSPVAAVAVARMLADGSTVTVSGVALTSSSFHEGGGYLADDSAGIAVLVAGTGFHSGERLRMTGRVEDRYQQLTLHVDGSAIEHLGSGEDPPPVETASGALGEGLEGRLLRVRGRIGGPPTQLAAGPAYEIDDGSGEARVVIGPDTGIQTDGWQRGADLTVVGVLGQRDSSGTGQAGYRLLPRGTHDVVALVPPAAPTPSPSGAWASNTPTPSASPRPLALSSIADARRADSGTALRVRGVVTAGRGEVDDADSAVLQDASGAILVRLPGGSSLAAARNASLEIVGVRSTRAGMATIRVDEVGALPATAAPLARDLATGEVGGEVYEAELVVVQGSVSSEPRRSSAGSLSFELDDGSGPLRVFLGAASTGALGEPTRGSWLEVTGIVGQETSGDQPSAGYRLWPRDARDVKVVAPATATGQDTFTQNDPLGEAAAPNETGAERPGEDGQAAEDSAGVQPADGPAPVLPSAASRSGGRDPGPPEEVAPGVSALERRRPLLLISTGGLTALLGVVGAIAWRRGTFARLAEQATEPEA